MSPFNLPQPTNVFKYFEEISRIPHGSENMEAIADYCVEFANKHNLKSVKDSANNVIIYKNATEGYEDAQTVILQGHLDMVCQKADGYEIDFDKDPLRLYVDGDFLKAENTTLGADNGIAVAMIMAILESDDIPHPALEAVFTTDEEIGMVGALALDTSLLKGKKMLNLDSEEEDTLTVSCAGGSDFRVTLPIERKETEGFEAEIILSGLQGGHSGMEIDKNRVNADILAGRLLNTICDSESISIISINGGDKGNAIPNKCTIKLCVKDPESFKEIAENTLETIKKEFTYREPDFTYSVTVNEKMLCNVISEKTARDIIFILNCAPDGVFTMSAEINGLVETSSNLGILKTNDADILLHFTLRSNKKSALIYLEEKFKTLIKSALSECTIETFGHYPPWEFNGNSQLQKLFKECYTQKYGKEPKIEAIHAGLECGVFTCAIEGLDCVALGPQLYDVHTVKERLSISSTENTFTLLKEMLKKCK